MKKDPWEVKTFLNLSNGHRTLRIMTDLGWPFYHTYLTYNTVSMGISGSGRPYISPGQVEAPWVFTSADVLNILKLVNLEGVSDINRRAIMWYLEKEGYL